MVKCKTSCGLYSAGDLQSRIVIQRATSAANGSGGIVDTWAELASVWAKWKAVSGGESWSAMRINPSIRVKAVIRFRGDDYGAPFYSPGDRVMYRNRQYAILAVIDPDDGQEWLELMLDEGKPS